MILAAMPAPSKLRPALAAVAAASVLALAACGEDDESGGKVSTAGGGTTGAKTATTGTTATEATGAATGDLSVSLVDFKLNPANPTVPAGVVEFTATNDGDAPHALEVEGPNGEQETPVLQSGKSAKLKVDLSKAGKYEWYCPVGNHREMGMRGEITVAGSSSSSDSGGATATTEDSGGGSSGY
jgi:uncharacterized cupredoxin-like copper-binding protein